MSECNNREPVTTSTENEIQKLTFIVDELCSPANMKEECEEEETRNNILMIF